MAAKAEETEKLDQSSGLSEEDSGLHPADIHIYSAKVNLKSLDPSHHATRFEPVTLPTSDSLSGDGDEGAAPKAPPKAAAPSEMTHLRLCCVTWNVGNEEPFVRPGEINALLHMEKGWDIIVVGTQECSYMKDVVAEDSQSDDDKSQQPGEGPGPGPRSLASLKSVDKTKSTKRVKSISAKKSDFQEQIEAHVGEEYFVVGAIDLVQMKLFVLAHKKHRESIPATSVQQDTEATGLMSVYGNKGGLAIKFDFLGTSLCFVSCHLAAHDHMLRKRNADTREILQGIHLGFKQFDVASQFDHTFWMGDLNYRIDLRTPHDALAPDPPNPEKLSKKSPVFTEHWGQVLEHSRSARWKELHDGDQLKREIAAGRALFGFQEGDLAFPPTFKVKRGRQIAGEESNWQHLQQRVPSYCDRVLWRSLPACEAACHLESVAAVPEVTSSDHKPVRASFVLDIPSAPLAMPAEELIRPPQLVLSGLCARNLIAADVGGSSDPYVVFQSSPPGLLCREDDEAPTSPVIEASLNPKWGEVRMALRLDRPDQLRRCSLLLSVWDKDKSSADDPLGSCAVALAPLFDTHDHSVPFSLPLVLYGQKTTGVIEGTLRILYAAGDLYEHNAVDVEYRPGVRSSTLPRRRTCCAKCKCNKCVVM